MNSYVAIDLGGTFIKIGLVRGSELIASSRIDADSAGGLGSRLPFMKEAVDRLLSESGIAPSGLFIAFAGIVDVGSRRPSSTNAKFDDAPGLDLESWVRDNWGIPMAIDNDARAAALGEWTKGAGRGCRNMVMMTIGTGIGSGAVVDGKPLYGRNFCAGSLGGHMILDYRGRRCSCGNIGCAEALGSSFFLPSILEELPGLSDGFRRDGSNADFKTLFEKFRSGESDAARVVEYCLDVWSAAVVNLEHAYDPETVVIGGGVMKSADIILPYLRKKVNSLVWCPGEHSRIVAGELGDNAALLASEYYFDKKV